MWNTIIIQPFVNGLLLINSFVNNFGITIILFTILIRLLTHPLTVQQFKATQGMQKLQEDPRYKKMQEKYKNDKERLAQEQMKLYKELGINPLGSCLPTLIQFPIIIGLYQGVMRGMAATPIELLRLERFIYSGLINAAELLPLQNRFLWMDLGQPERINVFGVAVPFLAILVVISTYLQSKLIQPPTTGANDQSAMMSKSMSIYMPLLMGYMAYELASGLALYFLVTNVFGIVQYAVIGRANWSNILPFMKKDTQPKTEKPKAKIVDVEAEEVPQPINAPKGFSSSKDLKQPKRKRPKYKK